MNIELSQENQKNEKNIGSSCSRWRYGNVILLSYSVLFFAWSWLLAQSCALATWEKLIELFLRTWGYVLSLFFYMEYRKKKHFFHSVSTFAIYLGRGSNATTYSEFSQKLQWNPCRIFFSSSFNCVNKPSGNHFNKEHEISSESLYFWFSVKSWIGAEGKLEGPWRKKWNRFFFFTNCFGKYWV